MEDSIQFDTIHSTKNALELSSKLNNMERKRSQYNDLLEHDTGKNSKEDKSHLIKDLI